MTKTDCYFLPSKAAQNLLERHVEKLSPVVIDDALPSGFRLVDTFDGEVRKTGRLLFATGNRLQLLSKDTGFLHQVSSRTDGYVADLDEGDVKTALQNISPLRRLQAIGETDIEEVTLAFVDSAQKTRVRARVWFMNASGGGSAALVVLQGLRGYDKALNQLRAHVLASGGGSFSDGALYKSLFPMQVVYVPKPKIAVGRKEAAFDAANDIIHAYLPIVRLNEPGIIKDIDIEFLHDYRIGLRKIRSVLSLFSEVYSDKMTVSLKQRFSSLMSPTGQLRDLDVYLAEKDKFYALLPKRLHAGLDALFALFANRRAEQQSILAKHLKSKAYTQEIEDLVSLFAKKKKLRKGKNAGQPALEYSRALIWKKYGKVCTIAANIDDQTEDEEVHNLRIQCKKLRYLMEFFAPVFPKKEFNSILQPLKKLQDNLGLFNDYSVQQESLHALLDELNTNQKGENLEIAQSLGALIVVLHGKQLQERARVVESFAKFNDAKTKETFQALFKKQKAKA